MKYNELSVVANKDRKRVGRGIAAGQGKTAGRGTKGQGARTGKKFGATFMGGQGPLVQRIPKKRGFRSLKAKAQVVYTGQLNQIKGTTVDAITLFEAGLVATPFHAIKLIARGDYTGKAAVKLQAASKGAVEQLTKAGGSFVAVDVATLPESTREKKQDLRSKKADNA